MTRTCYDSTNARDLPPTAKMALAYVDGLYGTDKTASPTAVRRQCRDALIVGVTVTGTHAPMADVEPGDLRPTADSCGKWAESERAHDKKPHTLYFPITWHDQIVVACKQRGLKIGRDVFFFGAHYTGQARIEPGYIGVQYEDPVQSHHHYDVSIVADHWPGVDPDKPLIRRLRHGKRRTARKLIRELRRRQVPVHPKDRPLLIQLRDQIRRLLGGKS